MALLGKRNYVDLCGEYRPLGVAVVGLLHLIHCALFSCNVVLGKDVLSLLRPCTYLVFIFNNLEISKYNIDLLGAIMILKKYYLDDLIVNINIGICCNTLFRLLCIL